MKSLQEFLDDTPEEYLDMAIERVQQSPDAFLVLSEVYLEGYIFRSSVTTMRKAVQAELVKIYEELQDAEAQQKI